MATTEFGLLTIEQIALNAHDIYGIPAVAPIVLNVSMIVFTVSASVWFEQAPIYGIVAGVLVVSWSGQHAGGYWLPHPY